MPKDKKKYRPNVGILIIVVKKKITEDKIIDFNITPNFIRNGTNSTSLLDDIAKFANDLEKFFLKHLIFTFAGGFSSYLTDKILPINNDALDIKDKLDMELVRIKASLTSMLLCSFVIGLIFSYISSSIKIFMDKKNESNGSSLPDLVLQQQQETNNNTNMNFRESIV